MRTPRLVAASVAALLAASLVACAPALPATVVPGTEVTATWSSELTSLNALADPTPGNVDIAAAVRGRFGDRVDGEFVPDPSFGTVEILKDDPFTVRYDLAEPSWSDGVPLDAADLVLGWASSVGLLAEDGAFVDAPTPPHVDEFARSIDVTFPAPTILWQAAVGAQVPAHVVGRIAFGLDDAMEAKQAVIRAVVDDDRPALSKIAKAWRDGFTIGDAGDLDPALAISSGPFLVESIERTDAGQSVVLTPNPGYRGTPTPQVARVVLAPGGDDPIAHVGDTFGVVQAAPTAADYPRVHELERRDTQVQTPNDGRVWSLALRSTGVFSSASARAAFLRMAPAGDMVDRGAGQWSSAYAKTTSMLALPGDRSYAVVAEDSGFAASIGTPAKDAAVDRGAAGVAAGTAVCVLYDRASEFAAGAFAALREGAAEAGWTVTDCGSGDVAASLAQGGWDAVIDRTAVPQTPAQLTAQWGTGTTSAIAGTADPDRDVLIARYAQTTDVYTARELLAQIEATIVRSAVARPLAANPVLTLVAPGVTGVAVRNGSTAALTSGIAQWAVAR